MEEKIQASITSGNNTPDTTKEALAAMVKQGILNELTKKHLSFEGKTTDKWWLQASIKEYLNSGKVSGSLLISIFKIAEDYESAINKQ